MPVRTIGTGGDFATIADWLSSIPSVVDAAYTGELLPQDFDEPVVISSSYVTTPTKYIELTAHSTAKHVGLAATASGQHARLLNNGYIQIATQYARVSWVETAWTRTDAAWMIGVFPIPSPTDIRIHHCLLHGDGLSTNFNHGAIVCNRDTTMQIYRNIVYGTGGYGIAVLANPALGSSLVYSNTIYKCNLNGDFGTSGLMITGSNVVSRNNVSIHNGGFRGDVWIQSGSDDYTATSDTSTVGAHSQTSITGSEYFNYAPSTSPIFANIDLRRKVYSGGSTDKLTDTGLDLGSPYNEDVQSEIASVWDLGADEYVNRFNQQPNTKAITITTYDPTFDIYGIIPTPLASITITTYAPTAIVLTTWYVATNGNDSWSGTLSAPNIGNTDGPFATPNKASSVALPGDTVYFREGTYTRAQADFNYTAVLEINTSGVEGYPITYKNYPDEIAILDSNKLNTYTIRVGLINYDGNGAGVSWIIVDGLRTTNSPRNGIYVFKSTDITIQNCYAYRNNAGWWYYNANSFESGIVLFGRCERVLIQNCRCYDNGGGILSYEEDTPEGVLGAFECVYLNNFCYANSNSGNPGNFSGLEFRFGDHCTMEGNVCYDNPDAGVNGLGFNFCKIVRNICLNNWGGGNQDGIKPNVRGGGCNLIASNIMAYGGSVAYDDAEGYGNILINNTIYKNGDNAPGDGWGILAEGEYMHMYNNISALNNENNTDGFREIMVNTGVEGAVWLMPDSHDYNLFQTESIPVYYADFSGDEPHTLNGDPSFVDPEIVFERVNGQVIHPEDLFPDLDDDGVVSTEDVRNYIASRYNLNMDSPCFHTGLNLQQIETNIASHVAELITALDVRATIYEAYPVEEFQKHQAAYRYRQLITELESSTDYGDLSDVEDLLGNDLYLENPVNMGAFSELTEIVIAVDLSSVIITTLSASYSVGVSPPQSVFIPQGTVSLTTFAPTTGLQSSSIVLPPKGTVVITRFAPNAALDSSNTVLPPCGIILLQCQSASISVGVSPPISLFIPIGSLTLTTFSFIAQLEASNVVLPSYGILLLSTYTADILSKLGSPNKPALENITIKSSHDIHDSPFDPDATIIIVSGYSHDYGLAHKTTQWSISGTSLTLSGYSTISIKSTAKGPVKQYANLHGADLNKLIIDLPLNKSDMSLQIRFQDSAGVWGLWSEIVTFTTGTKEYKRSGTELPVPVKTKKGATVTSNNRISITDTSTGAIVR